MVRELRDLPIDRITFTFDEGKTAKNARITLFINDSHPISFSGLRGHNLNVLFSGHGKFSSTKKTDAAENEYLRKDFDEVNQIVAKSWFEYGFVYGATDLIHSQKYDHKINSDFSHYILKK